MWIVGLWIGGFKNTTTRHSLTPQAAERALDGAAGTAYNSTVGKWVAKSNAEHVQICQHLIGSNIAGVYSCCPDATRLGQPAKDYLYSPIWAARKDAGFWCLPQEPCYFQEKLLYFQTSSF